jgi:hypothetical protein
MEVVFMLSGILALLSLKVSQRATVIKTINNGTAFLDLDTKALLVHAGRRFTLIFRSGRNWR